MLSLLNYNEKCDNLGDLPNITIVIKNDEYILQPDEYVVEVMIFYFSAPINFKVDEYDTNNICVPGLMAMDVPPPKGPVFILGALFIKKFYTIGNQKKKIF